jgi:hypothetical protein
MGAKSKEWIDSVTFSEIEVDDILTVRFMNGKAIVKEIDEKNEEVTVIFKGGCWDGKELMLIRHQIKKILNN